MGTRHRCTLARGSVIVRYIFGFLRNLIWHEDYLPISDKLVPHDFRPAAHSIALQEAEGIPEGTGGHFHGIGNDGLV